MEITTVIYEGNDGTRRKHTSSYLVTPAGLVLRFSEFSQSFIPWHRVHTIEQTFTESMPRHERLSKSLYERVRRGTNGD